MNQDLFGEKETESSSWSKWSIDIQPTLTFPMKKEGSKEVIKIVQNSKGFGELGSRIWNGSLVLSRYVEQLGEKFFLGKSALELGSGTGLVGIVVAKVSPLFVIPPLFSFFLQNCHTII